MKKITAILGIAAVAGVTYKVLTRKKTNGSTLLDDITDTGKEWTAKFNQFSDANSDWKGRFNQFVDHVKDKLMPNMTGPNGEVVFTDMYKRNYYKDSQGERVYME